MQIFGNKVYRQELSKWPNLVTLYEDVLVFSCLYFVPLNCLYHPLLAHSLTNPWRPDGREEKLCSLKVHIWALNWTTFSFKNLLAHNIGKTLILNGCHHSSVDSSASSIMGPGFKSQHTIYTFSIDSILYYICHCIEKRTK